MEPRNELTNAYCIMPCLAFSPFAPANSNPMATSTLSLYKLVFIACNLLTLALGLWKCSKLGILPTASDWRAFANPEPVVRRSPPPLVTIDTYTDLCLNSTLIERLCYREYIHSLRSCLSCLSPSLDIPETNALCRITCILSLRRERISRRRRGTPFTIAVKYRHNP